jgi:hypothetical protein
MCNSVIHHLRLAKQPGFQGFGLSPPATAAREILHLAPRRSSAWRWRAACSASGWHGSGAGTGTVHTLWPVPPRTRPPAGRVRHPEGVSNRISIKQ